MDKTIKKLSLEFCGKGMHKITVEKLFSAGNALLLDVRTQPEAKAIKFDFSHFGIDVLNIPLDQLPERHKELPTDRLIVTFCSGGTRAAFAYVYLASKGYENLRWFDGGYTELLSYLSPGKFLDK